MVKNNEYILNKDRFKIRNKTSEKYLKYFFNYI